MCIMDLFIYGCLIRAVSVDLDVVPFPLHVWSYLAPHLETVFDLLPFPFDYSLVDMYQRGESLQTSPGAMVLCSCPHYPVGLLVSRFFCSSADQQLCSLSMSYTSYCPQPGDCVLQL